MKLFACVKYAFKRKITKACAFSANLVILLYDNKISEEYDRK